MREDMVAGIVPYGEMVSSSSDDAVSQDAEKEETRIFQHES